MDQREARQYVMSNPPPDSNLAERRPSLLGRLFRRTSSLSSDDGSISAAVAAATATPNIVTMPQQAQTQAIRRDSISEAVQNQFIPRTQNMKPTPLIDPEFGIYT